MGDWTDWYAREDPTRWVMPHILREKAQAHPDRDYLKYEQRPWVSYGEVNARANRIANGLIARGVRTGTRCRCCCPTARSSCRSGTGSARPAP